uniref:Proline-serine-threonine phosphatase interacting protein 1b n=1 Tax=Cyprinus carpio TaxID=7962 RepID=A0A8C2E2Y7_CYPCA
MCVYLYIHNKYTQYTHIYYVNKTFILDVINLDFLFYFLAGSEKQYKWNVDQLEKMCQDWESTYRSACEVFQQQESERINILRCVLWEHCNLLSMQCVQDDDCCEEVRKILEQCDIITDNNCFIKMKKTACHPPALIEFRSYSDLNANGGVRRVETKRLSVMLPGMSFSAYPETGSNSAGSYTSAQQTGGGPEKYMVLYDFKAQEDDELSISKGQIVTITEKGEDGWWRAWRDGISGLVPRTYLTKISVQSQSTRLVAAHPDYNPIK